MIRSFAFTTQGKLHSKDVEAFLMPTLLADTNLFLWVDLEKATPEEIKLVLEDIFHFHALSIEDCVKGSRSWHHRKEQKYGERSPTGPPLPSLCGRCGGEVRQLRRG